MNITYKKIVEAKSLISEIMERITACPTKYEWGQLIRKVAKKDMCLAKSIYCVLESGTYIDGWYGMEFLMPSTSNCLLNRRWASKNFRKEVY